MNTIKKFNDFKSINEEYTPVEDRKFEVTVQDLIDYLSTLPPDTTVGLDHDGFDYMENGFETVKDSNVFYYMEKQKHLIINN